MNDNWQQFCNRYFSYPELGIALDISKMTFPESFLSEMQGKVSQAYQQMKELEAGAIANPDEQRMVGHYWLRDSSLAPSKEIRDAIEGSLKQIKDFAANIHSGKIKSSNGKTFTQLLLIGIGGSALGPQLLSDALGTCNDKMRVSFIDNTDPDGLLKILEGLGEAIGQTLVLVVSKSGGTAETRNGQLEVANFLQARGLDFTKHFVAVTGSDSKLDKIATQEGWVERFHMWDWVGGRTSLFSSVGLLPAALQGVDLDKLIAGARQMDALTRTTSNDNPAMLLALMWYVSGEGKGKKDMVVLPYKDRLLLFSRYLQQLVMESIGKQNDLDGKVVHQGIAVYGNKGSTDQHAYVQQLRDGLNNFFATFINVYSDYTPFTNARSEICVDPQIQSGDYLQGFFQGTRRALSENGRDSISILVDTLNEASFAALIALYERAVSFYASLVNINAYHQPGVEAGKKASAEVIEVMKKLLDVIGSEAKTVAQLASATNSSPETVFFVMEHLVTKGVQRVGPRQPDKVSYKK